MALKKYIVLIIVTVTLVVGSFFVPDIIASTLPETKLTKIQEVDYTEYVSASGEITQTNKKFIVTDFPMIVGDVLIKPGDTVKKGQTLLKVDREATATKAASLANYSSMADLPSEYTSMSYDEIYNKLPYEVVSTADGVIDTVSALTGEYLEKGGVIASFVSDGDLVAHILVPEDKISDVALGQPVEITGSGFEGRKYYGHIKTIAPSAKKVFLGTNQETVIDVVASIDNLDEKIKSGYTISARIITEELKKINIVPYESVMQDNSGKEYVYVFSNGTAIRKDIETGIELSDGVEVISGVGEQEAIISTPEKIKESGTKVIIAS